MSKRNLRKNQPVTPPTIFPPGFFPVMPPIIVEPEPKYPPKKLDK